MQNAKFKILNVLVISVLLLGVFSCSPKPEIRAVLVTGQNNHNTRGSNIALKSILEKAGMTVITATSPQKGEDMSEFIIDFTLFDVVVLNYTGDRWPEVTNDNFVSFVENGGGVVVVHAANNAFPDWKEYNQIIGLGGWGKRNETAGPYVYVEDGVVVRDEEAGH